MTPHSSPDDDEQTGPEAEFEVRPARYEGKYDN